MISEPNLSSFIGNFLKKFLKFFFNISMEDSPYGQYDYKKISKSIKNAKFSIEKRWYSVLVLLIFSGDYGGSKFFLIINSYLIYLFQLKMYSSIFLILLVYLNI